MNATANLNPAETAFLAGVGKSAVFCQVLIQRTSDGFILRHVNNTDSPADSLKRLSPAELRHLAQFTAAGAFRPLKSAPNLADGWQLETPDDASLLAALNTLYPGAVADWFAARAPTVPVTNYRDFTARQTGMYRITASLPDAPAEAAVAACCHEDFCLKRRLWTVGSLVPDNSPQKSVVPCLEPCAVMLEFARKVARWEQGIDAPESQENQSETAPAECDFDAPNNPRRQRFVLEKQRRAATSPL